MSRRPSPEMRHDEFPATRAGAERHHALHHSHVPCRVRRIFRWGVLGAVAAVAACTALPTRPPQPAELWGFTAPWDPRSDASLSAHRSVLTTAVTGWIALDSASYQPVTLYPDSFATHRDSLHRAGASPHYAALVTSYLGSHFWPETIRGLAETPAGLAKTAGALGTMAGTAGYHTLVLDFEGMTVNDLPALLTVSKALADSAHAHGVTQIGMAVPAPDTAAYPARPLLGALDFLVIMLYDQHWRTGPAGPIAAPDWVRRVLGVRVGEVGSAQLVAAFPIYGYQWRTDSATAAVSYDDAQRLATEAHVPLTRDPASQMLHAQTDRWTIWTSDAVALDTLMREARALGISRIALWRLGLEDRMVWR